MLSIFEKTGSGKGYNRKLREKNLISGILYGASIEPIMVEFSPREFTKLVRSSPKKYNSIFNVELVKADGKKTNESIILKDWQRHPVSEDYIHVDFFKFNPEETQVFRVPFGVTGRAKGVIAGGKLSVSIKKLKISARPDDVPVEIIYDITDLDRGEVIRISDLEYPKGVTPLYAPRQAVVSVTALKLGPNGMEMKDNDAVAEIELAMEE